MSASNASDLLHALGRFAVAKATFLLKVVSDLLLRPGSTFSLFSLASALIIAVLYVVIRRRLRGRRVRFKLVARALFPRWLTHSASTRADLGFMLLNVFALGGLIGWALLSYTTVSHWTQGALTHGVGPGGFVHIHPLAAGIGMTVVSFLVYELAYWLNHYVSHEIPFLWRFHRVHHTAETLTPLTVFRVHPIDTLVFYNMTAVMMGGVNGLGLYLLGGKVTSVTLFGGDAILLVFVFLTVHLQHSHVWIAFTGPWGRIFASPAHHQIHHSNNPAHFGKNLGSCLALFDWLFGTLRVPAPVREPIVYGVDAEGEKPHGITDGLITPFIHAFAGLGVALAARPAATAAPPERSSQASV